MKLAKPLLLFFFTVALCGSPLCCLASDKKSFSSVSKADFVPNYVATKPRDPDEPNRVLATTDPLNPPTDSPGPLSLDVVPQGFYFGKQKMFHQAHDYRAVGLPNYTQYIQVTDNRDAGINGWTVKVRQNHVLTEERTGRKLTGAYLKLPQGVAESTNSTNRIVIDQGLTTNEIILSSEDQTIFKADAVSGNVIGKGTSIAKWNAQDVLLHIPKETAAAGSYTNIVYWILSTEITN